MHQFIQMMREWLLSVHLPLHVTACHSNQAVVGSLRWHHPRIWNVTLLKVLTLLVVFLTLPYLASAANISGHVFEDVNFGGGEGRSMATAIADGATNSSNVRVELYDATGAFISSTLTSISGIYNFNGLVAGTYIVRVVNASASSSRSGYIAGTHLAVQTFRTNASSGVAVNVTDHVGGEVPNKVDAGNGSTSLAALTTASTTAQSITIATVGSVDITGIDFGFNFDLIVNVNNAGQGSLRQFIINANALSDAGLAIQGQAPSRDVSLFMIADGNAHPGLNVGMADLLTGGVAIIGLSTVLPAITSTMTLNGRLQTAFVGNNNPGTFGTGGTVGVDAEPIPLFNRPEVAIDANNFIGLQVQGGASNVIISNLAIYNASDAVQHRLGSGTGNIFRDLVLGATASGADPGGVLRNSSHGIQIASGTECTVDHCYIAHNGNSGILAVEPSATVTATYNEVFANGWNSSSHDGLDIDGRNCVVRYNLSHGMLTNSGVPESGGGSGVECGSTGYIGNLNNLFENNTLRDNISQGVTIRSGADGNIVRKNIITGNALGVLDVKESRTAKNNLITQNSIYDNDGIGIDLSQAASGGDGVTVNDGAFNTAQSNNGIDAPTITSAVLSGGNLTTSGYVGNAPGQSVFAGLVVEFFRSDNDPSGYGEGRTYLGTLTTDASGNFGGTMTVSGLASGDLITTTATDGAGNTSEFGGNKVPNIPPTANCQDIAASMGTSGTVSIYASDIDNGSFDTDGSITSMVLVPSIFHCGDAVLQTVQLTVTDDLGATSTCSAQVTLNIPDNDGDGICDALDLDDDNDGIPDDIECPNLLTHGDFEYFTGLSNGNNIGINIYPWIMGGGQQANIVQVDGAGGFDYGQHGPYQDADPITGAGILQHYLDIASGSNDIYQTFTLSTSTTIVYSGAFSSRENAPGEGGISILSGVGLSGAFMDGTGLQTINAYGDSEHTPWQMFERTVTLAAGTYSYVVAMTDYLNFDEANIRGTCPDTDGDGIVDYLDLDSDNDGIYDCVESGNMAPHTNGVLNGPVNPHGIPMSADANDDGHTDYTLKDSDGDGKYDFTELDSDGDGCLDVTEAGFIDTNADGSPGHAPISVDGNGRVTSLTP
ncbi:MAG: right-handed parallel beta-helix repeat-containing protein [Flavobacteriales bacterium]|nr:right-handed parallel beta-helix repeat-containing protein [Flavobacteriales bacterium]